LKSRKKTPSQLIALIACLFFFLAGLAVIPHLGLQNDEALFAQALYEPKDGLYTYRIGPWRFPLMLMSYLGTLKSAIYSVLFPVFGVSILSIRIPMLLAGTASIWIFHRFLVRVAGERAAVIGCVLLAADAMYLLTTCLDWGPVALQHLLLLAGMSALANFWDHRRMAVLAGGFFLIGLACWDKALAFWMMGGLGVAAGVTLWRQIVAIVTPRRISVAILSFTLGALPLILYNIHTDVGTFRQTASYDAGNKPQKIRVMELTLRGSAMFGWLVAEDRPESSRPALTVLQKTAAGVASLAGQPRQSLFWYGFWAALLLVPFARGPALRAVLFGTIAMTVAWVQMLFTSGAGGAVHHTILLWPLPQMIVAISLDAAASRLGRVGTPVLAVATLLMVGSGVAVINQYFIMAVRNGGAMNWTDAIFPLSTYTRTVPGKYFFCLDWGILDSLRLLNQGTLPLRVGTDQLLKTEWTPKDRELMDSMISRPEHIFLGHKEGLEFYPGVNARLLHLAQAEDYQKEVIGEISDSHGRPTFEIFHFRKSTPGIYPH
jgi:hypothetical protein